jgi:peptide deformylase
MYPTLAALARRGTARAAAAPAAAIQHARAAATAPSGVAAGGSLSAAAAGGAAAGKRPAPPVRPTDDADDAAAVSRASSSSTTSSHRIVAYPADVLRARCAPVTDFAAPAFRHTAAALADAAAAHQALGLAAPQLGSLLRVFVMMAPAACTEQEARALTRARRRELARSPPTFLTCVNPRIVAASDATALGVESCLSVPDYTGVVRRHTEVEVEYADAAGAPVRAVLAGLPAVVFQHELDHLDGVLLIDREERAFIARSREEEMAAAQERYLLGLAKYYNAQGLDERMA